MKHLIFLILLAFAIPAHSQEQSTFNPSDHRRTKNPELEYRNPLDPADHRRIRTPEIRTTRRPRGTIGTIISGSLLVTGITMIAVAPHANPESQSELFWGGYIISLYGVTSTLICGTVLLVNVFNHPRYALTIGNGKVGLAYNF